MAGVRRFLPEGAFAITREQVEKMKNHMREIWVHVGNLPAIEKPVKDELLVMVDLILEIEKQ
jgi:hypothetical protein